MNIWSQEWHDLSNFLVYYHWLSGLIKHRVVSSLDFGFLLLRQLFHFNLLLRLFLLFLILKRYSKLVILKLKDHLLEL